MADAQSGSSTNGGSPEVPKAPEAEKGSPALNPEIVLDTKGELDDLEKKIREKKSEKERQDLLITSLQELPNQDENRVVEQTKSNEALTDEVKDYLTVGASMLAAVAQIQGKSLEHPSDLVDAFQNDSRVSVRQFAQTAAFLLAHHETPASQWFTTEGWTKALKVKGEIMQAVTELTPEMDAEKAGDKDKGKDKKPEGMSDTTKGLLLLGGVVGGIWALKKLIEKECGKAPADTVGNVAWYGGLAATGYFAMGMALNNDDIRGWISKDNDHWMNSGFFRGAMAFAHGEFGNMWSSWTGEAPSEEQLQRDKRLAGIFEVDGDRLPSIERMNFKDFMGGKPSTFFNLSAQADADEKIRGRINSYYLDKLKTLPDYESLTMGQVFQMALSRGMLREVDPTKVSPADRGALEAQDKAQQDRLAGLVGALDAPADKMDVLKKNNSEMLSDIKILDEHVEGHWEDISYALAKMLWCDPFGAENPGDLYEEHDLTLARQQLLAGFKDGIGQDHAVFEGLAKQVQGFDEFLKAHPDPKQWTEADRTQFETFKEQIITIRQRLDSCLATANEANAKDIAADREHYTWDDIKDVGTFSLSMLSGGAYVLQTEWQYVTEGNVVAIGLAMTQVGGAAYEVVKASGKGPLVQVAKALKGSVMGPVKVAKIPFEIMHYRNAFRYTTEEIVQKLMTGELSETEVDTILKHVEEYKSFYVKFAVRDQGVAKLEKDVAKLLKLKQDLLDFQPQWKQFFETGTPMTAEAKAALCRSMPSQGGIAALEDLFKSGKLVNVAARMELRPGAAGQEVWVDGKKLMNATEEEAKEIEKMIIAKGAEVGKTIDAVKLKTVWRYMKPIMGIVGIADTVRISYRISTANSKEELQKVVAEETSIILSFLAGTALSAKIVTTLIKPTSPGSTFVIAVLSVMGGLGIGLGLDTPIEEMLESYLTQFPNGYEVTREAASALEGFSLMSSAKLNTKLVGYVGGKMMAMETGQAAKRVAAETAGKVGASVMESTVAQGGKRMAKDVVEKIGLRLSAFVERHYVAEIAKVCGEVAIETLMKQASVKGVVAGGLALVDGPLPIGDALAAIFLAWTAKDVADMSILMWQGYKLKTELDQRLPLPVTNIKILEPASLVAKYASADQNNGDELFEMILQEPSAKVQIQRAGNAGFEVWSIENSEVSNMTLYDLTGKRIAGMSDEDIQQVVAAGEQIKAHEATPEAQPAA